MKFSTLPKCKFLLEVIFALLFTFGIVLLLGSLYDTGDDLTMRNVSLNNSYELIWSKAIYGKILLLLPTHIVSFARYDFLSFILLGLNLAFLLNAISKFLKACSANKFFYYILICLVYVQFLIRPQFTNTAGLLALTGLLNIVVYLKEESIQNLYIGLGMLLFSYWIRAEMTFVILFIGFPFLMFFLKKWNFPRIIKKVYLPILFFLTVIVLTFFVEKSTYNSVLHETMIYKRKVISPFFDYNFGRKLLKPSNEDILNASTLSKNDVYLLNAKYFDWPQIDTLLPYLEKAEKWYFEERDYKSSRLLSAKLSFKYFVQYEVFFLTLAIFFYFILNLGRLNRRLFFFIILSVLFALLVFGWYGYIQRAFLSRLYYTPLFGLIILLLSFIGKRANRLSKVSLLILLTANVTYQIGVHRQNVKDAYQARSDWSNFKKYNSNIIEQLVTWGGGPNGIFLNPVYLPGIKTLDSEAYYGVGYGGNPNIKQAPVNRLLRGEVVYYAINPDNIILLKTFFYEKFSKELNVILIDEKFSIYKIKLNINK